LLNPILIHGVDDQLTAGKIYRAILDLDTFLGI
jgi:hypothetical protein